MHARVVFNVTRPEKIDQVYSIMSGPAGLAAMQQKGCKGLLTLGDRKTRKGIAITLWETEADMMASETGPYWETALAMAKEFITGPQTIEHYEVMAQA